MAAATSERTTPALQGAVPTVLPFPVAANTKIYKGTIVVLNAGYAAPGSTATGLICVGRAEETQDNTGGAAGAKTIQVRCGVFKYNNSASSDLIAQANAGANCYIVDDNTVALTNGTNTRSAGGKIAGVDAGGVWVAMGLAYL